MNDQTSEPRLSFDQSYFENKSAFIIRLVRAGWTEEEAEQEWFNVQDESEGDL